LIIVAIFMFVFQSSDNRCSSTFFLSRVCLNSNASDKNFHNKLQAIKTR
jgi:hypothetical protein